MGEIEVTIKYLVSLADKVGKRKETVAFKEGTTLIDIAEWLNAQYNIDLPNPRIMTVLNGKGWEQYPEKTATLLQSGDTILLFPPIAGG